MGDKLTALCFSLKSFLFRRLTDIEHSRDISFRKERRKEDFVNWFLWETNELVKHSQKLTSNVDYEKGERRGRRRKRRKKIVRNENEILLKFTPVNQP